MRKNFDSNGSKNYYTKTNGIVGVYLNELTKCDILDEKYVRELIGLAQKGDKKSEELIVKSHLKFGVTIAKRFSNSDYDLLCDLISEANIGLLESIQKFDLSYNNKFITFAKDWMLKRVYDYLSFKNDIIKISNKHHHTKIKGITNKFYLENGRMPDLIELSDIIDDDTINEVNIVDIDSTYLSEFYNDKNNDLINFNLNFFNKNEFEDKIESDYFKTIIHSTIGELTQKEKDVVKMLYGIEQILPMDMQMVADTIGLSYEAVRVINKKALHKMKNKIESDIIIF